MANRTKKPVKDEQVIDKEDRAFKLRVQGWSQQHIATELGMSQQGVSVVLKRASERFAKNFLDKMKHVKDEQCAQLEQMCDNAIMAWEKSKKSKLYKDVGDPKHIELWRRLKEDIRKVLGIHLIDNGGDDDKKDQVFKKIQIEMIDSRTVEKELSKDDDQDQGDGASA